MRAIDEERFLIDVMGAPVLKERKPVLMSIVRQEGPSWKQKAERIKELILMDYDEQPSLFPWFKTREYVFKWAQVRMTEFERHGQNAKKVGPSTKDETDDDETRPGPS